MSKKDFVKQSLAPIAVLLAICIVCVGVLAVLNDLLFVTDEARFNRAMAKIYNKSGVTFDDPATPNAEFAKNDSYGEVLNVIAASDGAYVLETLSNPVGYGGAVALYVVITPDAKIYSWSVKDADGETLISSFKDKHFTTWYIGHDISNSVSPVVKGSEDSSPYISGVTMTSNAINHAINMACYYARNALGLGNNPEADAMSAIEALLVGTDAEGITLAGVPAGNFAHFAVGDVAPTFVFKGMVGEEAIFAFAYGDAYVVFKAVANDSERVVIASSGNATDDMKSTAVKYYFDDTAYITAINGGKYTVVGNKIKTPDAYTLDVTIDNTGKVTAIDLVVDGYAPGIPHEDANKLLTSLVGATIATVDSLYNDNKVTGATNSADIIRNAVKLVLTNVSATAGVKSPEDTAKESVTTLLNGTTLEGVALTTKATAKVAHYGTDKVTVAYAFTATKDAKDYLALTYSDNSIVVVELTDNDGVILAESNATDDIKTLAQTIVETDDAILVAIETGAGATTYTVIGKTKSGYTPSAYTLGVTVDDTGKVTAIDLVVDGYVPGIPHEDANKLLTSLVGATIATVDSLYNDNKVTYATHSADIIRNAVKLALTIANGGAN